MSVGDIRQLYPEQFERIMQLGELRAQNLAKWAERKERKEAKRRDSRCGLLDRRNNSRLRGSALAGRILIELA